MQHWWARWEAYVIALLSAIILALGTEWYMMSHRITRIESMMVPRAEINLLAERLSQMEIRLSSVEYTQERTIAIVIERLVPKTPPTLP